ncbi:hypothetical protein [Methanomethylophilus alvi]|uniref:hypothetical protein n=1 Tax=Methanomethylophilus alvi TaxID=1291540 RepID=UPI0037DCF5C7
MSEKGGIFETDVPISEILCQFPTTVAGDEIYGLSCNLVELDFFSSPFSLDVECGFHAVLVVALLTDTVEIIMTAINLENRGVLRSAELAVTDIHVCALRGDHFLSPCLYL